MVRELMHDPLFLGMRSANAAREDIETARDLCDTLDAHRGECVGMAANMIGVRRRIIAFVDGNEIVLMLNPVILKTEGPYETEEGCLSLLGGPRKTRRWKRIKVQYLTIDFKLRIKNYEGFTAQIIQHEVDHCNGVLI